MDATARAAGGDIEHPGLNLIIVGAVVLQNALLFLVLPLWLLPASAHWAWLLLPLTLLTVTHWATIHEAIHGSLHPERAVNDRLGRALAVLFGSPFDVVRFGHLSHHALNGKEADRPEVYDPEATSGVLYRVVFYLRLLVGLYASELLSAPASLLPRRWLRPLVRRVFYEDRPEGRRMAERAERQLLEPGRLRATRTDALLIILLLGLAAWLYGAFWPLLVVALLGRAFMVSFMDNAPHYGGEMDDWGQGYDMRVPALVGALILNSNLHGTHHRHPNVPWRLLPRTFRRDGQSYAGNYLTVPWRQLKGPIPIGRATTGNQMRAPGPAS